jgi:hypothetical protein
MHPGRQKFSPFYEHDIMLIRRAMATSSLHVHCLEVQTNRYKLPRRI